MRWSEVKGHFDLILEDTILSRPSAYLTGLYRSLLFMFVEFFATRFSLFLV